MVILDKYSIGNMFNNIDNLSDNIQLKYLIPNEINNQVNIYTIMIIEKYSEIQIPHNIYDNIFQNHYR